MSAIRIIDIIRPRQADTTVNFVVLTYLHTHTFDIAAHILKIQMVGLSDNTWKPVAGADDHQFNYAYSADPLAPGAYVLSTRVELDLAPLEPLGTYYVEALLDGKLVARVPLTLRRN